MNLIAGTTGSSSSKVACDTTDSERRGGGACVAFTQIPGAGDRDGCVVSICILLGIVSKRAENHAIFALSICPRISHI